MNAIVKTLGVFCLAAGTGLTAVAAGEKPTKKMNILCVCGHPDDAEISCGGTLLKYRKQGHNVFIVLTTSGNTGSNIIRDTKEIERVREAEMLESAKIYDAKVRFLRADDDAISVEDAGTDHRITADTKREAAAVRLPRQIPLDILDR